VKAKRNILTILVLTLVALAGTLFTHKVLNDPDSYWHVAAGNWMIEHSQILKHDEFSHTRLGSAWGTHEWLSEILMALSWRAAGWSGLLVLTGLCAASAIILMGQRLSKDLNWLILGIFLFFAAANVAPSLLARPHILVLPIVVLWMIRLLKAREADKAPHIGWSLLMIPWANMHGSYLLGFVLAGMMGFEALSDSPRGQHLKVVREWGLFGLASLVAALITPHSAGGLVHAIELMSMSNIEAIEEWAPYDMSGFAPLTMTLFAVLAIGFLRGVKVPPARMLLLLILFFMALEHQRHAMILALIAPLLLAEPFGEALEEKPPPSPGDTRRVWAAFAAIALVLISVRLALPLIRKDDVQSPISALAATPEEVRARPVLNAYNFGGYLIYEGVPTFIDGRADMFGEEFLQYYIDIAAGDEDLLDEAIEEYEIGWTIFKPDDEIVEVLNEKPGWRVLYEDDTAIVHVRDASTDVTQADQSSSPAGEG
jgi:hypothetical protein